MAYYGYDGGESQPALVSAPVENEISADDPAGEGCDALPSMAARITKTEGTVLRQRPTGRERVWRPGSSA